MLQRRERHGACAAWHAGGVADVPDRVAAAAARIAAAGRTAHPSLAVSDAAIVARLDARLRDDPDARLDDLHDADLFLEGYSLGLHMPGSDGEPSDGDLPSGTCGDPSID